VSISENVFENSFRFPTLSNEYGILMLLKNKAIIPDVVYDGIYPPEQTYRTKNIKFASRITVL